MVGRSGSVAFVLFLTTLVITGMLMHDYTAQPASRFAFTAALVEQRSVALDGYEGVMGIDRAVRDGRTYSDKAPGQPFLAVPFYWVSTVVGAAPGDVLVIEENSRLWWLTLWSSAVPGAALAVLMRRLAARFDPGRATEAAILVFFGTLLFPFSAMLFGHVLAALILFGAYLNLVGKGTPGTLMTAGLLGGLAVLVEYTAAVGVAILTVAAVTRYRARSLWMLGAAAPMAALLMWYNTVAFGGPLTFSYQFSAFSGVRDQPLEVGDQFQPGWETLVQLVLGGRGLLLATPVVIVALVVSIKAARSDPFGHGIALAMFLGFATIPALWPNPWGGDSPGARYLVPCLPFLVVPLTTALQRHRRVTMLAGLISIATMTLATVTNPLIPVSERGGFGIWMQTALAGDVAPTVIGTGWPITVALVGATVLFSWISLAMDRRVIALRRPDPLADPIGFDRPATDVDQGT